MKKYCWLKNWIVWITAFALIATMTQQAIAQNIVKGSDSDARIQSYALSDLTGVGDINLRGVSPSYYFFIPVPEEWKLIGLTLQLQITHSELLQVDSSLTIIVNDKPIESLRLTSENKGPFVWEVSIPSEILKGDSIAIGFVGLLRVTDNVCDDLENPANWARISSQSSVSFTFYPQPLKLELSKFPYPFVRTRALTSDQVVVITPSDASGEEMNPVFNVASALGAQSTWRGLKLFTFSEDQYTDEMKSRYDAIFVGTAKRLNLAGLGVKGGVEIGLDGRLTLPNNSIIPDDSGVLMIISSPWNSERAIMIITGQTLIAVKKAAMALRHSQFTSLVRGQYAVISSLPEDLSSTKGGPNWESTDLNALGFQDQAVYGIGKHTLSIPLTLPNGLQPMEIKIKVIFSHSPFVSTDKSYVTLSANGIPQVGLFMNTENEQRFEWEVTIPAAQLMPGKNLIEVLFDLHLVGDEICTDYYLDKAWGVLHRDSNIKVTFESNVVQPDLFNYPVPFGRDTLVVISSSVSKEERAGIFQLISQLGALLGSQSRYLEMTTADGVTASELKGHSLILIGSPESNAWVDEALRSAPVKFDKLSRSLRTKLFNLSLEDGQPVGLVQELISPWDTTHSVLIISGTSNAGISWALDLLANPTMRTRLKGDIAIVDETGDLTLMNSRAPETSISPVNLPEEYKGPTEMIMWISLSAGLIIMVVCLIIVLVRRRRAKH